MAHKIHKTRGIVLRSVKYGETSLIVSIFTFDLGIQSYLINGVRSSSKKGSGKAGVFQPAAVLDLVVYHNELSNLQRVKEFKWNFLYQSVLSDITKNAIAVFMVELLTKCLKQPEANEDLFHFAEDCFIQLDGCNETVAANFPLFFALHLPVFFGFQIDDQFSDQHSFLDLQEGTFVNDQPVHPYFLDEKQSAIVADLLRVRQPSELEDIKLNRDFRRTLLFALEPYYAFHIQEFGRLKTLPILKDILG